MRFFLLSGKLNENQGFPTFIIRTRSKNLFILQQISSVLTDTNSFCNMIDLLGGAVAQLGECLTGSQEVVGSNPISSTTKSPLI